MIWWTDQVSRLLLYVRRICLVCIKLQSGVINQLLNFRVFVFE